MGLFHDTLGGLDDHPELNVPEGFGEAITGAYEQDMAGGVDSANAKIAELTGLLDAATDTIASLKSQNYDLLMATSAVAPAGDNDGLPDPADSDADLPGDGGIDDVLFEDIDPEEDKD